MSNQDQLIQQLGALTAALEGQHTQTQMQAPQPLAQAPAPVAPQMQISPEMMQQWMQKQLGVQKEEVEPQEPLQEPQEKNDDTQEVAQRLELAEQTIAKLHSSFEAMLKHLSQEMEARFKHVVMRMNLEQTQSAERMQKMELETALLKRELAQDVAPKPVHIVKKPKMRDIISDISTDEPTLAQVEGETEEQGEDELSQNTQGEFARSKKDLAQIVSCEENQEEPTSSVPAPNVSSLSHQKSKPQKLTRRKKQRMKGRSSSSRGEPQKVEAK